MIRVNQVSVFTTLNVKQQVRLLEYLNNINSIFDNFINYLNAQNIPQDERNTSIKFNELMIIDTISLQNLIFLPLSLKVKETIHLT